MTNRIKDAFDLVQAEEELKAKTIGFLHTHTRKKKRVSSGFKISFAAALFSVFLLLGVSGYHAYFTETSLISVDVNPSLEISLNRFNRVLSVEGYNSEGEDVASSLTLRNMSFTEAITTLMQSETLSKYIKDDSLITFTVISDSQKEEQLVQEIEASTKTETREINCYIGKPEDVALAHANGLSFGKYQAYTELLKWDSTITPDKVRSLSMREIQNLIRSYSGEDYLPSSHGNGLGTQNHSSNPNHSVDGQNQESGYGKGKRYGANSSVS